MTINLIIANTLLQAAVFLCSSRLGYLGCFNQATRHTSSVVHLLSWRIQTILVTQMYRLLCCHLDLIYIIHDYLIVANILLQAAVFLALGLTVAC